MHYPPSSQRPLLPQADIIVAGGMESMTNIPYALRFFLSLSSISHSYSYHSYSYHSYFSHCARSYSSHSNTSRSSVAHPSRLPLSSALPLTFALFLTRVQILHNQGSLWRLQVQHPFLLLLHTHAHRTYAYTRGNPCHFISFLTPPPPPPSPLLLQIRRRQACVRHAGVRESVTLLCRISGLASVTIVLWCGAGMLHPFA